VSPLGNPVLILASGLLLGYALRKLARLVAALSLALAGLAAYLWVNGIALLDPIGLLGLIKRACLSGLNSITFLAGLSLGLCWDRAFKALAALASLFKR